MNDFGLADKLMYEIQQVKMGSLSPREELYRVYGRIQMARELDAISIDDFVRLNHACVADGINNPKYF